MCLVSKQILEWPAKKLLSTKGFSLFQIYAKQLETKQDLDGWRREWIAYSNKWQAGEEFYPVKAEGDALAISKALFRKYLG